MKKIRLDSKTRKLINRYFSQMINTGKNNKYYDSIPLHEYFAVLRAHNIVPLQEDNTMWSGFLVGEQGNARIEIAPFESGVNRDGLAFYNPFSNAMFILSWYRMPSNRYEVSAYIS